VRSVTLPGHKSRRLDLHQHHPVYKTGASLFGHVGSIGTRGEGLGARTRFPECRDAFLVPSPQPPVPSFYFSSSTFQYASLMNFVQLSIRTSWNA
jgi:hypothetical protein